MTCHYNGNGGGAINDYGRAVFASELVARTFTDKSADQLGEESGFLGTTEIPWWIRPGIKYRGLALQTGVGGSAQTDRWINMQADLDMVFNFDKKNIFSLITNFGYVPTPRRFQTSTEPKPSNWISRQHYLRWQIQKGLVLYTGLMDKTFGLRHADHTAVNRSLLGLGQSDQSHGIILQNMNDLYDVSINAFVGNLSQEKESRQQGLALTGEYYLDKMFGLGGSIIASESDYKAEKRYALLSRTGFAKGKSFILELGYYDNKSKTTVVKDSRGYYSFLQGLIGLEQGYNLMTTYQILKPESSTSTETDILSFGFLIFPFQKTEFRFEVVNSRSLVADNTSPDQWSLMGQVHTSW